ncbi:sugar porter family MFS transporter [Sunxiuqinia sp. A32]|uniref:sugar porter family MFS transporter n=1 Tax=Sunxiuqinia sp. A32 TaxID=3461496 RepID=UPI0040453938
MKNYVVFISVIVAFGGLLFGFDTGVIAGTLIFIQPYFGLSEVALGWTVSSLLFGCVLGVLMAGKIGDKYGRKKVLMLAAFLFLISSIGSATSKMVLVFIFFRIIGGVAVGVASILSPMYIAEVSPAKYRGRLVSLNQLAIVSGILVAFFTNYLLVDTGINNWRWMLTIDAIPAIILFFGLFFVPESPRWLVGIGKIEKAMAVLLKTSKDSEATLRLEEIKQTVTVKEQASYRDLLSPKAKRILWIGVLLAIFQQITGINTIMYYAPKIFAQVGQSNDSALLQTIAIGGTNLVFTVVAMLLIDRLGRKKLILLGSAGMAVMLISLSFLYFQNITTGALILVFVLGYIAFFAASFGPALWVIVSEIFPNKLRSKGMSITLVSLWAACIGVTIVFPVMLDVFSGAATFLIFGLICILSFWYVWRFVPETKGKTLEELEKELIK